MRVESVFFQLREAQSLAAPPNARVWPPESNAAYPQESLDVHSGQRFLVFDTHKKVKSKEAETEKGTKNWKPKYMKNSTT